MRWQLLHITIAILTILGCSTISAQEHHKDQHQNSFMHHRVALMIAHTHVPDAGTGTQSSGVIVPSWGISYEYWINHQ